METWWRELKWRKGVGGLLKISFLCILMSAACDAPLMAFSLLYRVYPWNIHHIQLLTGLYDC